MARWMSAVVEALDLFDEVEGEGVVAAGARHRVVLAEEIEVAALAVVAVAPRRAFEVVLNFADAARRSVGVVPVLLAVAAEAAPAYIAAVLRRGVAVLVPGGPTVRAARGLQQWLDREG